MIYAAYLNGEKFFNTSAKYDGYLASAATVDLEIGCAGEAAFTIPPKNIMYGSFNKLVDLVSVYRDGTEIFCGRVYGETGKFNTVHTVTCEGYLAVLNDSILPPGTYECSLDEMVGAIVDNHNEQCPTWPITVGVLEVEDDYLYREYVNYESSKTRLDALVDSYGGYLEIRHENDTFYLDWRDYDSTIIEGQGVNFGENLIDVSQESTADGIITALIPLGANLTEEETTTNDDGEEETTTTEYTVDISSVNDGLMYIYDEDAVEKYGWVWGVYQWEDVEEPANLLAKATAYLAGVCGSKVTVEVTAVDLANIDETVEHFQIGTLTHVTAEPQGIDEDFLVTSLSLNLLNPSADTLVLGSTHEGFVSASAKQYQSNVKLIEGIKADYATNTALSAVAEKVRTNTSLITQLSDLIGLYVSEDTTVGSTVVESLQASIELTAEEILSTVAASYATTDYVTTAVQSASETIIESVTEQYESAISQSAEEILSTVAASYATTTYVDESASALQEAIEAADELADEANAAAADAYSAATAVYGECSTASSTAAKEVECDGFELFIGASITVAFTYANSAGTISLNVDNSGDISVYVSSATATTSNYLMWGAGAEIRFVYNGTYWVYAGGATSYKVTCGTAAATQTKAVTINKGVICKGTNLDITWTYGNTYSSGAVTINVNSTGVKSVYYGSTITSEDNPLEISAGETMSFTFNGLYWYVSESAALTRIADATETLSTAISQTAEDITAVASSVSTLSEDVSMMVRLTTDGVEVAKLVDDEYTSTKTLIDDTGITITDSTGALTYFEALAEGVNIYADGNLGLKAQSEGVTLYSGGNTGLELDSSGVSIYYSGELGTRIISDSNYGTKIDSESGIYEVAEDGQIWLASKGDGTNGHIAINAQGSGSNVQLSSISGNINLVAYDGGVYATPNTGGDTEYPIVVGSSNKCCYVDVGDIDVAGGSGSVSSATVTFNVTFKSSPVIFVTAVTTVPGNVDYVGVAGRSTTGCTVYMMRSDSATTNVQWLAVGYL